MGENQEVEKVVKVRVEGGYDETCAVFNIHGEDHTLGNAVRYMVMKNVESDFCGYSVPHPSEDVINVRVQTKKGSTAIDVLTKSLDDIAAACDVIERKFDDAVEQFGNR